MKLAVVLAFLLVPAVAVAGDPSGRKLGKSRTSLLGDHLSVTMPQGMAARRASIMAAESASEDETRGMLDDGKARFVMMSYELYVKAGKDFQAAVVADAKRQKLTAAPVPLALPKPLVGFAIEPEVTTDAEANLVYLAWVSGDDGTVQRLAYYVNPEGAKQGSKWAQLAKRVTASLKPGKRVLTSKAGERALGELKITLPEPWVTSTQPGPDFTVFHLRQLAVLGEPSPSCGIYVGTNPSMQYEQQEAKVTPKPVAGKLFGAKVDWQAWEQGGRQQLEVIAKIPSGEALAHVFCNAASTAEVESLRKLMETLR